MDINQPVPEAVFESTTGSQQRLSDFRGQAVVLYFYPKDNTPGCTLQAENFRENFNKFQNINAIILGVSRDSIRSHQNFTQKLQLPFVFISDKDETLCRLFDVIKPKTMYGKPVRGIERSTFLIDAQGILRREWRSVKVEGHVAEVLAELNSLKIVSTPTVDF